MACFTSESPIDRSPATSSDVGPPRDGDTRSWEVEDDGTVADNRGTYLVCALQCESPLARSVSVDLRPLAALSIGRAAAGAREVEVMFGHPERSARMDVPDLLMSRDHAMVHRSGGGWAVEDRGSKNGTAVNGVAVRRVRLVDGDLIEIGGTSFVFRTGQPRPRIDEIQALAADSTTADLFTLNSSLGSAFIRLANVATRTVPVLVQGETGAGKEIAARAVHALSGRTGRFVAVNCGALASTLIEAELFGYEAGAFSGADSARDGLVRRADGGTLLLDEVAELPASCQASLLRVLQEGEVRPVGGTAALYVDVRFVAATHQDLEAAVEAGRFRRDLYARLAGFQFSMPPLRQRREDMGALVAALLTRIAGERAHAIRLSRAAARALMCHAYPLNIRELEHALAAAVALAESGRIEPGHLPAAMTPGTASVTLSSDDRALRARVVAMLVQEHGNVSAVARAMDKAPIQIRRWCKRLGIDIERFRD